MRDTKAIASMTGAIRAPYCVHDTKAIAPVTKAIRAPYCVHDTKAIAPVTKAIRDPYSVRATKAIAPVTKGIRAPYCVRDVSFDVAILFFNAAGDPGLAFVLPPGCQTFADAPFQIVVLLFFVMPWAHN